MFNYYHLVLIIVVNHHFVFYFLFFARAMHKDATCISRRIFQVFWTIWQYFIGGLGGEASLFFRIAENDVRLIICILLENKK
jgi:hypothetical protein